MTDNTMLTSPRPINPDGQSSARFRSSAQIMVLPKGLYMATAKLTAGMAQVVKGVSFPSSQLGSVPQPGTQPLQFLSKSVLSQSVWIQEKDEVIIDVPDSASPLLVTNYMYGPELQSCLDLEIKSLSSAPKAPTVGLQVVAHIQQVGQQTFAAGQWAAAEDAPFWIEAVRIDTSTGVGPLLQYHVPGNRNSDANWMAAPGWLGNPGGGRPLSGIAFRLAAPLSDTHHAVYSARFLRHGEVEGVDGEPCRSPQPQDPLIALRVAIVPR